MVDTDENVPRTGRVEIDINRPSDLSLPYFLLLLSCFLHCVLCLARERVVETSSRAAQVTRSTAKQTPKGATLSLSKRPILSLAKGSSSNRPKS